MSLAALLCYALYQYFAWPEGYWAVVTTSAITRANMSGTYIKASLRLVGTLIGAFVGYLCAYLIHDGVIWLTCVFLLFTTFTAYIALQTRPYSYAAVVAGFTSVVIISSKVMGDVEALALFRTLEVILGILISALVSTMMVPVVKGKDHFFDGKMPQGIREVFRHIQRSKETLFAALRISLTASATFLAWLILRYPYGFWATITVLIIMEESFEKTTKKSYMRLLGQILAAIYGLMIVLMADGNVYFIGTALVIGFFVSGFIIGSDCSVADLGNHAGSAIAIMLLVGMQSNTLDVVMGRFFNVVAGILIANLVMFMSKEI
jgi:uncharacterized membrane protein YccC